MENTPKTKSLLPAVARIFMGIVFLFFGLNGVFNFLPRPKTMPEFAEALAKTGYMFPMIVGTQVLVGILLVLNRFVPLALALIAPIILNIVTFHLFLERSGLAVGVVLMALELYLAWAYRNSFRPMLAARTEPN